MSDTVENTPEVESNLPSDNVQPANPFAIPEDRIVDGKLDGKWDSYEAMNKSYNDMSKAYTDNKREQAEGKVAVENEATKSEVVKSLTDQFIENGMSVTDEMKATASEAGFSNEEMLQMQLDATNGVSKGNDLKAKYSEQVGGTENYTNMLAWANDNVGDDVKRSFDANILGDNGSLVVEALYSRYAKANGINGNTAVDRVRGDGNGSSGLKPYTAEERSADLAYLRSNRGRNDKAAQAKYQARANLG